MMTSSNGNIFRVTDHLCGEFTGPGEFPTQRPVTRSFEVSFDLHLNERLSKQSWGWWFETLSRPLWHHCNDSKIWRSYPDKCVHWNENVIILMNCSSLNAPEVVILAISGASSDGNFVEMAILPYQCYKEISFSKLSTIDTLSLCSLSGRTSYGKISWNLEAARFGFKLFQSLWNLAGTSAAALLRCLSKFRAIPSF